MSNRDDGGVQVRMSDFCNYDYQIVVDALIKVGHQLNKPNLRGMKGDLISIAIEVATNRRLTYVDQLGYDSIDTVTGLKYEFKSQRKFFDSDGHTSVATNLRNTRRKRNSDLVFNKTFDYLFCIQTDPKNFAIAQFDWQTCYDNHYYQDGQFNMTKGMLVPTWICKGNTVVKNLPEVKIDMRKMLEDIING